MGEFEVIVLGSASGMPEIERSHACFALQRMDEIWLLDCGEGACSALLRWGLDPLDLKGICITHTHPDHCVGLFMILQYLHMKNWRQTLPIYLPTLAIEAFEPLLDQLYLIQGQINLEYALLPIESRLKLAEDVVLETFPTGHLRRWEEYAFIGIDTRAYAFRLTTGEHSLFYSGDVASFDDIAPHLRAGDTLIVEGAHVELAEVVTRSEAVGVRKVIVTHLPPDEGRKTEEIERFQGAGRLELIRAQDGMRLSL